MPDVSYGVALEIIKNKHNDSDQSNFISHQRIHQPLITDPQRHQNQNSHHLSQKIPSTLRQINR